MMFHFRTLLNLTGDHLHTLPLVVLYLTDGCNSRCRTCDIWQNPRRNMPLALVDQIVSECDALGVRWVLLSGGEAMQHPHWPHIARQFRARGIHVMLLTNGLNLRKQAEDVRASVDEVIVSLDAGNAANYHHIRGVDAFDLVLAGIAEVRRAGLPVTTRTTIQRDNFREMAQIIDVALAHDVNTISFLAVDVSNPVAFGNRTGDSADDALSLADVEDLDALIDTLATQHADAFAQGRIAESPAKLKRILVQHFRSRHGTAAPIAPPCNAPHFSTVIEVDGRLRPCYFLPTYGRLQPDGESLSQAINWQAARDLRRAYRTGQRQECTQCVCPLHKGARQLLGM